MDLFFIFSKGLRFIFEPSERKLVTGNCCVIKLLLCFIASVVLAEDSLKATSGTGSAAPYVESKYKKYVALC